jgi:large subunit ribosomal protein L21
MNAYAVIQTGGKQYLVRADEVVTVERLPQPEGTDIEIKPVLAASDGAKLTVGRPDLQNAAINATVLKHVRGPKVVSFKQKRRKGYRRKKGHRQELTVLKIKGIKSGL